MARRLLITEDDASLRQMLEWEFQDLGYQVTVAGCCSETRILSRERHFDLALIDYNLPDGLGTDLVALLHQRSPDLPVVIYSGRDSACRMKLQSAAIEGICRFVAKPVGARALHRIFDELLSGPCRSAIKPGP